MWRKVQASTKLAAALVVVGTITIVSLVTVGCRPTPEGSVALDQPRPPHPASTTGTFDELVLNADKPVVVIFTSQKCGACREVEEGMIALANQFEGSVDFVWVEKHIAPELVMELKVHNFPTVMLYAQGEEVNRWGGLETKKLEAELNPLLEREH